MHDPTVFKNRLSAIVCALFIAPLALTGCADSGSDSSSGGTDSGSSSGADGGASSGNASSGGTSSGGTSSGGTSSGGTSSGGTSSGGTSSGGTSSGGTSSGGGPTTMSLLKEIQKGANYAKCVDFDNQSKGVTIKSLTVTSPRRYVSGKADGIYAQQKGGGHYSGLYVTGEPKSAIADLKAGDVITVTGDNKGYYCSQQLDAEIVHQEKGTELPVATTVTLAQVGDQAKIEDNQHSENALVQLHDVTVVDLVGDKANFGNLYIGKDDKDKALVVTIVRDKGWDTNLASAKYENKKWEWTYNVKKGDKIKTLRGVLSFSWNHWRLHPTLVVK